MAVKHGLALVVVVSLIPSAAALDLLKEGQKLFDSFSGSSQDLSVGEIAGGLKDALRVGTESSYK